MAARQYKREPLSAEEVQRLEAACDSFDEKLGVWVLLDTGLRVSELAGLTKDSIHWQDRRLAIRGKGGPFGKKSKLRMVPMTERVYQLLSHRFSFRNELGMSDRTLERVVRRVANRAVISKPVSPHVLRHTWAVTCIKKGVNLRALQYLLGHDRLGTTEIYLNLAPEDAMREFAVKFGAQVPQ
jgi:integrase/recombinase XerD